MFSRILIVMLILLIATQAQVYAYTDPGSGTLIWQMLLAASFGVMFYMRRLIGWFRGIKSGREKRSSTGAITDDADEE
jgi:uncharacterized membrane protein YbhN (UPF0104 family)